MNEADAGAGALRAVAVLLGMALVAVGVVILVDGYTQDYSCAIDLSCHDASGTEPAVGDRLAAAFGFGLEKGPNSDLPGPQGLVLLAGGVLLLLIALAASVGRSRQATTEGRAGGQGSPPPPPVRPDRVDTPGPRQRVFLDR